MTFNSLKQSVYSAVSKQTFSAEDTETLFVNRIITCCVLLDTLQTLINTNSKYNGQISELASSYASTIRSSVESLEGKYVCYKTLKSTILGYKLTSFISMTQKQVDEVNSLYANKQEVADLKLTTYNQFMYNVSSLTENQNSKLRNIHYNVVVPIVKYYMSFMGISVSDVDVESYSTSQPTKAILLAIDGVSVNQIYSDLSRDTMSVSKYITKYEITTDSYIKITLS